MSSKLGKYRIIIAGPFQGRWRSEGDVIELTKAQAKYQGHRVMTEADWQKLFDTSASPTPTKTKKGASKK